jgi:hypothetical protein
MNKPSHSNANLARLVTMLQDFYHASRTLDYLRHHFGNPHNMSPRDRDRFYDSKDSIIRFNDALVDAIPASAGQFTFDELLAFLTEEFSAQDNPKNAADFHERAREALVGMRNEVAVEQLLTAGGVQFRRGTVEEDGKGGDLFVEGIPIDFKSDEYSAERARMRTEEDGYDSGMIVWSHIEFEDFEGKLVLPRERTLAIFAELQPELDTAISTHKHPPTAHAI